MKWKFLWSWKKSDYTKHKTGTGSNGGDYAFHETHNIFGRMNSGQMELLEVVRHTTSAEFCYDEVSASFTNSHQMGDAVFIDCEDNFTIYTQMDKDSKEFSLHEFGQPIGFYTAMKPTSFDVWNEDLVEEENIASADERANRYQILKDVFGSHSSEDNLTF